VPTRAKNSLITSAMKCGPLSERRLKRCAETTEVFQEALSCQKCRSMFCMIKLNPSCKRICIYNYKDIPPVWKRSYEVYVKAFRRWVGRRREAMSMNRYLHHAHLMTTRTVIYEPPVVLTLKVPSFVCVFETL
jgi:hypothetical protein